MESIESIVSVYNFSKNLFTCRNSIKTRKHKLLKTPQNVRAFKHTARHVQELCNSLSDTSERQSPGNAFGPIRTTLFSLKLTFFSRSDGN